MHTSIHVRPTIKHWHSTGRGHVSTEEPCPWRPHPRPISINLNSRHSTGSEYLFLVMCPPVCDKLRPYRLCPEEARYNCAVTIVDGLWMVRGKICVGTSAGKLQHEGIRKRLLTLLDAPGVEDRVLCGDIYTSPTLIEEEKEFVAQVRSNKVPKFELDTTMTAVKLDDGTMLLHSPVRYTKELHCHLMEVTHTRFDVSILIASNLQHWLEIRSWTNVFPHAVVHVAPPSHGECLEEKLCLPRDRLRVLSKKGSIVPQLQHRLIDGAGLMLNEVAFLHVPSNTLIVSDCFYSGYDPALTVLYPTVFARVWFKLTKRHWSAVQLPSYRIQRILSHGCPKTLMACVEEMMLDWNPAAIVAAHGNRYPWTANAGPTFVQSWRDGLKIAGWIEDE